MASISFIRHAESQANRDGVWNGRADGSLSAGGEASLDLLGKRLHDQHFDVVVCSPLRRAKLTAKAFATEVETDEDFLELDIGDWEGATREEVLAEDGDYLRRAIFERELAMGHHGESLEELNRRVVSAVDALAERLGEDGHAAVVTHGGVIQEVLRRHLGARARRVHAYVGNTSISRIIWSFERPRLAVFNDLGNLGPRPATAQTHLDSGEPVLALIRHGQTRANTEGRWQGQGDWGLDEVGHAQAAALRDWYGALSTVYASPLGRAQATAGYVSRNGVVTVDGLKEIAMGVWEGLTSEEIIESWPELMETIYREGIDLKRGETGESWGELTRRFTSTVNSVEPSRDEPTAIVAHGGAIRAYVSSLTSTTDSHSESLYTPGNTSVTHVAMTEEGPLLLDYAVAPHLERIS